MNSDPRPQPNPQPNPQSNPQPNSQANPQTYLSALNGSQPIQPASVFQVNTAQVSDDELDLKQILKMLKRRWSTVCTVSTLLFVLTSSWVVSRPSQYDGRFRLLVEPVTTGSRIAESLTNAAEIQDIMKSDDSESRLDYTSQIEVLKSERILEPIFAQIQQRYPNLSYGEFSNRLKISRPKDSKILEFTYGSDDPEQIHFILQKLSTALIQYSLSDRQTNLNKAIEFVDSQIQKQRSEVSSLEGRLEAFRRRNNLSDPVEQGKSLTAQLNDMREKQRQNQIDLTAAQTSLAYLRQQVGMSSEAAILASSLSEAPIYQQLIGRLREVESQLALESARYKDNTPVIQTLQDQRQELLPLLQAEAARVIGNRIDANQLTYQGSVARDLTKDFVAAANQVEVLTNQGIAQVQALNQLSQQMQSMAGMSREYDQIQRNLQIYTSSLNRLLQTRENLQIEAARQQSPWELISTISDDNINQVSKPILSLAIAGLVSLLSGAAIALLQEQLDGTLRAVEDLKDTKLTCLGAIPLNPNLKNFSRELRSPHPAMYTASFMEAFYSLDANLRLLGSGHPLRSITVTSSKPGEGKSTIAAHLARTAASMGRRVLLVDMDMRHPQIHDLFNIDNTNGISQAISTQVNPADLIQASPECSNLFLLPTGQLSMNPGQLFDSSKLEQLTSTFAAFDLVIYDSPPLLGFADAKLIAAHTDGILLVVGLGKTEKRVLNRALEALKTTVQAPVLGIVANRAPQDTDMSNYNHYYRRYYRQIPQAPVEQSR
jgi:polysaccharide biosynthesis transport protein